jgi:hydroxyacylglutathione hydrolase
MYFNQIAVPGLGCLSYVIGCPRAKAMAVVDPKRDVQDYLTIAREEGMQITHVINTHVHADHVSGDQELRLATGADIYIHESAPVEYTHKDLKEGDVFEIGAAKIEVLHTPGHTPNSISLLVTDKARPKNRRCCSPAICSFVGDIGRPDLPGAEILDEQVQNLYQSLYVKLADYPDHLEVFPAHGEGSLCGRGMSAKKSSTLGYERRANPMLGFPPSRRSRAEVMSAFPVRPKSFSHIIQTNLQGAATWTPVPWTKPDPKQFEEMMADGAVIIDARDSAAFGGFHIPGSINIGFEKQLANWVGMVVDPNAEIILVVDDREDYDRMVTELHRIGYDLIFGYLSGGIMAWLMSGRAVEQLEQTSPQQLKSQPGKEQHSHHRCAHTGRMGRQAASSGPSISPCPTSSTIKFPPAEKDEELVLQCGSGYRSNIAASIMKQAGYTNVKSLAGGIFAWSNAGLPVVSN